MGFEDQLTTWRDYYLALAGAAAVLLGLVYVALSLHVERFEEPRTSALAYGAQALLNHGNALIVALAALAPFRPPVLPGIVVVLAGLNGIVNSVNLVRQARQPTPAPTSLGARAGPQILPNVHRRLLCVGGILMMVRSSTGLYVVPAAAVGLILVAMQNTWWVLLHGRRSRPG